MLKKAIKIRTKIIKKDDGQFLLEQWENCVFVNTGEAPVKINAIIYKTGESVVYGQNIDGYLDDQVSITFPNNTRGLKQEVVCEYELIPGAYKNC